MVCKTMGAGVIININLIDNRGEICYNYKCQEGKDDIIRWVVPLNSDK